MSLLETEADTDRLVIDKGVGAGGVSWEPG